MKKNKVLKQTWAKLLAFALAVISSVAMVFCAASTVLFDVEDVFGQPGEELRKEVNRTLMGGYCAELYKSSGIASNWNTHAEGTPDWDALDGGNIRYSVFSEAGNVLYSNDRSIDKNHCLASYEMNAGCEIRNGGRCDFFSLLCRERVGADVMICDAEVSEIVYDQDAGLFYFKCTDDGYYLITEFGIQNNYGGDTEKFFELQDQADGEKLYQSEMGKSLAAEDVKALEKGETYMGTPEGASIDQNIRSVKSIPENEVVPTDWVSYEEYDDSYTLLQYQPVNNEAGYLVCMDVADSLQQDMVLNNGVTDYFPQAEALSSFLINFRQTCGWYLALFAILFLAASVFLMKAAGRRVEDEKIHIRFVDKVPFELLSLAALGLSVCFVLLGVLMMDFVDDGSISFSLALAGGILALCLCATVIVSYCMSFAVRVKTKNFWRYSFLHYLLTPFRWAKEMLVAKTPLLFKAVAVFAVVALLEAIGVSVCMYDPEPMMIGFIMFKLLEFAILLWLVHQLYRIREGGRRIAAGDYSQTIDTSHMLGELKKHAENINNVGNGISQAVEEKIKSERFKTELITNVSHDIKTPLTSIINYVDLIKKEQVDNVKLAEYVEVLDRQSARLKKLIEDLMEASKASTGNLPVHPEVCDATVMLTQVVGEFEDRAKANDLELVVESPNPPANIMADGRHLWRIIDNLMSNICKYAMPGTRVYINLEKFNGMVIMTFRNISKSRLNITSEELMERFVRGDSSRNTEGNGLGLSIAQSLTNLMNGNLALQIDGDLFKVILSFDECPEETEENKISS